MAAIGQDEAAEIAAQRERLETLQQEIQQQRAAAERLGEREQSVIAELRRVERERGVTEALVATIEREIEGRTAQIDEVRGRLARAQDELTVKRQILARRLRSIYKLGRFGIIEVLFRSDSFADALSRYKYLRMIAEQDDRLVDRISGLEARIRDNLEALNRAREELERTRNARLVHADRLMVTEREREQLLGRVKSERSEHLEAAQALEQETEQIQRVIVALERRRAEREAAARAAGDVPRTGTSTLTAEIGALDWPVEGEIITLFGRARHPVYGTQVVNNGIDIRAPRGTPIYSVGLGEVAFVDWNGSYGLMVIVDHDGGVYSVYAHLERADVTVGQAVGARQILGTVGDSGSLEGPKLHFEIREGRNAVDPIGWLQDR